jgi:hypothetical protein
MKPTLEETLRRVLKVSRGNGWSVAIFAGLCSLVAVALGDPVGVAVGLLVTLGGLLEVRGHRQLQRGDPAGLKGLVRAQFVVLGVIWIYAVTRLVSFDEEIARQLATPDMKSTLTELGLALDDILPLVRRVFYLFYGAVMAATLLYQGGLALYYRRRAPAVTQALAVPPLSPLSTPPPGDYTI